MQSVLNAGVLVRCQRKELVRHLARILPDHLSQRRAPLLLVVRRQVIQRLKHLLLHPFHHTHIRTRRRHRPERPQQRLQHGPRRRLYGVSGKCASEFRDEYVGDVEEEAALVLVIGQRQLRHQRHPLPHQALLPPAPTQVP